MCNQRECTSEDSATALLSVRLPQPTRAEGTLADYARVGLTLGPHPLAQIRDRLSQARCIGSKTLRARSQNSFARVAGLVTLRQRPQTASGATFVTLEDEHGLINVIVWRDVAERQQCTLLEARLLGVDGKWEMHDDVCHLVAARLLDMSTMLGDLDVRSRDFQ